MVWLHESVAICAGSFDPLTHNMRRNCASCTFLNPPSRLTCEMCELPAPAEDPTPTVEEPEEGESANEKLTANALDFAIVNRNTAVRYDPVLVV